MKGIHLLLIAAASAVASPALATTVHVVRYSDDGDGRRELVFETTEQDDRVEAGSKFTERSFPQFVAEHKPLGRERLVELRGPDRTALMRALASRGVAPRIQSSGLERADEVVTLVSSGPSANRIDLVFMGDGYTAAERETFFADMQRMVDDMFRDDTFRSYLPLFNVHAVFRPSNESGIGRNSRAKDTAYGLYREGNTLRAIYPGKPAAARESCAAAPGCDYPVIIGNDPHYGGLGGEFAISTSSVTSGTVVLRHELGHNFGRVGEEYDGGGYFGQNWSSAVSSLKWRHWASNENVRPEPAKARFLAWPWHNLTQGPYRATFRSDGQYAKRAVRFSASGIGTNDTLKVTLDGAPFTFTPRGDDDRAFYDFVLDGGFSNGSHELKFEEQVRDGNNWVSNLTIHEYAADFNDQEGFIGAFPVFNPDTSVAGYRPTNEACLMRDMTSRHFCSVCQENNWLEFFGRVKLIDAVDIERSAEAVTVSLKAQGVGQFRQGERRMDDGKVAIKWLRNGAEVPALRDQASWSLPARDATGRWEVQAEFLTPEVRLDSRGLLKDKKTLDI